MKNYKRALFDALNESTENEKYFLEGYSQDFIDNAYISSQYLSDAITEFADNNTSIYYADIKDFIANNIDAVTDAINEFGWDGCGGDLYKAGQTAEFLAIERTIYDELTDIIKYIALDFLDATEEANEDTERVWKSLAENKKAEIIDECILGLENIDGNSRLDEITDLFADYTQNILNEDTKSNEKIKINNELYTVDALRIGYNVITGCNNEEMTDQQIIEYMTNILNEDTEAE